MRFFDVFDAQGRKLGSFRISPVAPGAGGLGYVLTALLLLLSFWRRGLGLAGLFSGRVLSHIYTARCYNHDSGGTGQRSLCDDL